MNYYLTYNKQTAHQITIQELLLRIPTDTTPKNEHITVLINNIPSETMEKIKKDLIPMEQALQTAAMGAFNPETIPEHYHHFRIPKHSGGWRDINAPEEGLKLYLRYIKDLFEYKLKMLPHDAAYAYVKGRSTVDALNKHKNNNANWFLKLDIKDFFPSHTKEYIMNRLKEIYPTALLMDSEIVGEPNATLNKQHLERIIDSCLLNGELPQGSPVSPTLTNILMTPIDYRIKKALSDEPDIFYTYTRYADDILISSVKKFNAHEIITLIEAIFQNTPFKIKNEKTRFGSKNGRNWNLGIMYNKDKRLTIGHKNNQKLRAAIFQFMSDNLTEDNKWTTIQAQELLGQISYAKMIDEKYVSHILSKYSQKFNKNIVETLKSYLS